MENAAESVRCFNFPSIKESVPHYKKSLLYEGFFFLGLKSEVQTYSGAHTFWIRVIIYHKNYYSHKGTSLGTLNSVYIKGDSQNGSVHH